MKTLFACFKDWTCNFNESNALGSHKPQIKIHVHNLRTMNEKVFASAMRIGLVSLQLLLFVTTIRSKAAAARIRGSHYQSLLDTSYS